MWLSCDCHVIGECFKYHGHRSWIIPREYSQRKVIYLLCIPTIITITYLLIYNNRGLLARSIITAQSASPTFTNVYACLVSIINTKFPQTGELIIKRIIIQFRKSFRRNDKKICLSSVRFIAHLVNQQVRGWPYSLDPIPLSYNKMLYWIITWKFYCIYNVYTFIKNTILMFIIIGSSRVACFRGAYSTAGSPNEWFGWGSCWVLERMWG